MDKTITVVVRARSCGTPKYEKFIRRQHARCTLMTRSNLKLHIGDTVEITVQTRPLSKLKRFRLTKVVQCARPVRLIANDLSGTR